jgi:HEAT repeat protein
LGSIKEVRAVEPLAATLKSQDHGDVRLEAVKALASLGAPGVEPLLVALKDPYRDVRMEAVEVLGSIKDSRAIEPLLAAVESYLDVDGVAKALGSIGSPAVERLLARLNDENVYVRQAVTRALRWIQDVRSIEPLAAAVKDPDHEVRVEAVKALASLGAPAVEPLLAALKNPDPDVRQTATWALGSIRDPRAVEPLIATLQDSHARLEAVKALGLMRDMRAVEPLVTVFREQYSTMMANEWRVEMEKALGSFGAPAVEALVAALEDLDPRVRQQTAWVLGESHWWRSSPSKSGARTLEGEELAIISRTAGDAFPQVNMSSFGWQWTQGSQLFWTRAGQGAGLTLDLPVGEGGEFDISAAFTKAPDYGIVSLVVEGHRLQEPIDLYSPEVIHSGEMPLGRVRLKGGKNRLEVTILDKNPKSSGHAFGLDWIRLLPVLPKGPSE